LRLLTRRGLSLPFRRVLTLFSVNETHQTFVLSHIANQLLFGRFFDEKCQSEIRRPIRDTLFSKLLFYTLSLFERLAKLTNAADLYANWRSQLRYRTHAPAIGPPLLRRHSFSGAR
jgi:hypothetical protein